MRILKAATRINISVAFVGRRKGDILGFRICYTNFNHDVIGNVSVLVS